MKVYRFLKRFNLSIRVGIHIGQQLPPYSTDIIMYFLHEVISIRKTHNINKENLINVDENANMPFNKIILMRSKNNMYYSYSTTRKMQNFDTFRYRRR